MLKSKARLLQTVQCIKANLEKNKNKLNIRNSGCSIQNVLHLKLRGCFTTSSVLLPSHWLFLTFSCEGAAWNKLLLLLCFEFSHAVQLFLSVFPFNKHSVKVCKVFLSPPSKDCGARSSTGSVACNKRALSMLSKPSPVCFFLLPLLFIHKMRAFDSDRPDIFSNSALPLLSIAAAELLP